MQPFKSLADLKRRATKGAKFKLVWSAKPHKYLNITRSIETRQSNGVMFEGGSWLYWGKADEYQFDPEFPIYTVLFGDKPWLQYEQVE